ncbi:putative metalloprotease CJM1_0395 family protein [Ferrimonas kyonanensis]|uniref:putative metalloprotease CJM1_0395 family protein n=1 Tax=Ferrimonas kyonanensis TaxID=364763 RepID=UPI000419A02C|nr:putative metalloprotease CJM1_0395 family protein [Ferrimonas kyonanensis]
MSLSSLPPTNAVAPLTPIHSGQAEPSPANPKQSEPVQPDAVTATQTGQKSATDADASRSSHPGQTQTDADSAPSSAEARLVEQQLQQLQTRDQEVKTHEQAHANAGGQHAGRPKYEFTRGSDGRMYASDGEVSIDTGKIEGDPQATIDKMQTVIQAANAPAQPSNQDRKVAAQAAVIMSEARAEMLQEVQQAEQEADSELTAASTEKTSDTPSATDTNAQPAAKLDIEDSDNDQAQSRLQNQMVKAGAYQQAFPPGTVIDDRL